MHFLCSVFLEIIFYSKIIQLRWGKDWKKFVLKCLWIVFPRGFIVQYANQQILWWWREMLYYSDSPVRYVYVCNKHLKRLFHNYFVYGKRWKIRRIIAAPWLLPFGWDASFKSFPHFIWKLIWKPLGNRGFLPSFKIHSSKDI